MNTVSINERVESIKKDEEGINRLVEEYKPFIASCVEKATGRYVRYGEDDELSIGLMAFVEAIQSFESSKGNFLSFAQNVIKRRLIDYYRKEQKHNNVISMNEYFNCEEGEEKDLSVGESVNNFNADEISKNRRLEIEEIKKELFTWEISFQDLMKVSPKHDKTRKLCQEILKFLLSRPDLINLMKVKKYLPIAEIESGLNIPRKKIERSRKYIIALVIISTGDYQYIKDYINI